MLAPFLSSRADLSAWRSTFALESAFGVLVDCHAVQAPLAMTIRLWVGAAVFCDDFLKKLRFGGFQAVGAGILLVVNEQAHRAESLKSTQKTTPKAKCAKMC
ncbi:hypothetical protein [Helicobacter canis]|uniref:hypothetical protein n=1 Tax=Helicobacter canis TaxID=29419 RepID=UPI0011C02767|nr:hypothetical protein [Helicobacter canis]